jgi:hypothetical protein
LFVKPTNPATKETASLCSGQIALINSLYELGANYYLTGTLGPKLSLGYQNRAILKKTGIQYPQSDQKYVSTTVSDFFY